jgi:hypothetical protein
MSPDRLEIAQRLAACRHWRWLPGMLATPERPDMAWCGSVRVHAHDRDAGMFELGGAAFMRDIGRIPDLDDDLTRLGVLAVVRRAWKCHAWTAPYVQWSPEGNLDWFMVEIPVAPTYDAGRARFNGPTEESALLAALEAAP